MKRTKTRNDQKILININLVTQYTNQVKNLPRKYIRQDLLPRKIKKKEAKEHP